MIERTKLRSEEDKHNKIYIAYYNSYIVGFVGISVIDSEYNISVSNCLNFNSSFSTGRKQFFKPKNVILKQ